MEFKNKIPSNTFRTTNAPWNLLCLNAPWSVGYVSTLIESENFAKKEDWEIFYYKSGEERLILLQQYNAAQQQFLNNHTLQKTKPEHIKKTPKPALNLNLNFGRTKSELTEKGTILFNHLQQTGHQISIEHCIEAVRFRVICETWNGIILRERNTIKILEKQFPKSEFHKTDGDFDHIYAVDYEIFKNGNLICGIQIKPNSYTFSTPYILKAKAANQRKNELYQNDFGAPVFDLIAKRNGEILNPRILHIIQSKF